MEENNPDGADAQTLDEQVCQLLKKLKLEDEEFIRSQFHPETLRTLIQALSADDKRELLGDIFVWYLYMSLGVAALGEMVLYRKLCGTAEGDFWFNFAVCCFYQIFDTTTCKGKIQPRTNHFDLQSSKWSFLFTSPDETMQKSIMDTVSYLEEYRMKQGAHLDVDNTFEENGHFGFFWKRDGSSFTKEFRRGMNNGQRFLELATRIKAITLVVITLAGTKHPLALNGKQRKIPLGIERSPEALQSQFPLRIKEPIYSNFLKITAQSADEAKKYTMLHLLEQAKFGAQLALDPQKWIADNAKADEELGPNFLYILNLVAQMAFSLAFCNFIDMNPDVKIPRKEKRKISKARKLRNRVAAHNGDKEEEKGPAMKFFFDDNLNIVGANDIAELLSKDELASYIVQIDDFLQKLKEQPNNNNNNTSD